MTVKLVIFQVAGSSHSTQDDGFVGSGQRLHGFACDW